MKKLLSALCWCSLLVFTAAAQDFPTFGKITAEEINLKECDFDKEAAAVVLLDEAVANYDDDYHLITYRHVRIKILKENGFDFANVAIPFYRKDNKEIVEKIEADIINIDDKGAVSISTVDKKSFYKKEVNTYWSETVFAFPNVKVGSIIEYKYRKFSDHYGFLDDWKFHDRLPVLKSSFTLHVPPRLEFTYKVEKLDEYPVTVKRDEANGSVYFEMNNLPGLDDEPYMDARKDYLQLVAFQLSGVNSVYSGFTKTNTTWKEVINDFQASSSFGTQLRKNLAGADEFIEGVKKLPGDTEKMKAVFEYVRSSMNWNGFNSRYAGDGVKDAWNRKTGTNGEINLILINLLKEAGLEVYPLLVSERWHGAVNIVYPFIDQFNTVFAYVITGNKKYYLDATDKYTPFNLIPKDILNTKALIVNRKNGGITDIVNDEVQFQEYVNTVITVDAAGKIKGDVSIKSDNYARVERLTVLKGKGEEAFVQRVLKNDDFKVTGFKVLNKENDSLALEQQFNLTGQAKNSGGYLFVPLNNFSGFTTNPFIGQNRFSDINFGYKRKVNTYTSVFLPEGFEPESLPKPVRMTTPEKDISFTRTLEHDKVNNTVICIVDIDFIKSKYNYYEYDILTQVYKKLFDYLKEPLVLKKK